MPPASDSKLNRLGVLADNGPGPDHPCYFTRWLIQAVNKLGKPDAIRHHSKACPASGSILKACDALGSIMMV